MSSHRAYDAPDIAGPWVPDPILSEKRFDAPRVADQRLVSRSDEPTCLRRLVTLGMRAEQLELETQTREQRCGLLATGPVSLRPQTVRLL